MPVEPITITAAVAQTVQHVEVALRTIQDIPCRQSATGNLRVSKLTKLELIDITGLEYQLQLILSIISTWKDLWINAGGVAANSFIHLWGDEGQSKILYRWHMIVSKSSQVLEQVEQLAERCDSLNPSSNERWSKVYRFLRKSNRASHAIRNLHQATELTSVRQIAWQVVEQLGTLRDDAESFFRRLHGPGMFSGLLKYRYVPTAIYNVFQQQNRPLYLDLRLVDRQNGTKRLSNLIHQREIRLEFHLILASSEKAGQLQHLTLKGVGTTKPEVGGAAEQIKQSPKESLQLSQMKSRDCFSFHIPSDNGKKYEAMVAESFTTTSFEGLHAKDFGVGKLSSELSNRLPSLSVSHKLSIAGQLAESTLLLLGTPWLTHMSSDTIRQLRTDNSKDYMCLYIDPQKLSNTPKSSYFPTIQQRQIFILGLTLLELALEKPREKLWKQDMQPSQVLSNYRSLYDRQIERTMGFPYSKACEFCFIETVRADEDDESDLELEALNADLELDGLTERYYSEVIIRLGGNSDTF